MKGGVGSILISACLILSLLSITNSNNQSEKVSEGWQNSFHPLKFGSNKPHLMFHVGSRDTISHNMAYGYWLQKPSQPTEKSAKSSLYSSKFSQLRYKYQNTKDEVYVNVLNHDGQKLIWSEIKDYRYHLESEIKYMYEKSSSQNQFEYLINWKHFDADYDQNQQNIFENTIDKQQGTQSQEFQQGNLYWFIALSIQNSQLNLINHKDYLSPICFSLQKTASNQILVHLEELQMQTNRNYDYQKKQTFSFTASNLNEIKMFGFTVNISESYQSLNYLKEFKHLLELVKYSHLNIPRKNDTKIVAWENKQIEQIKKGYFDSKYTFAIVYGKVERQTLLNSNQNKQFPHIYVTNSTNSNKNFDSKKFDIMALQNEQNLFGQRVKNMEKQEDKQFVKHVIYNLLGGMTYYEGKLYTQNSIMSHQHDYSFTFTPSRLIFPRSFLWDDGFHNSVVANYKPDLTLQVLHSWFKKVDLFGWIGREQIRGFEISSMMPDSRFIYQDVFQLNPPTIVMPVLKLLENRNNLSQQTNQNLISMLQNHFPSLEKHFRYFIKTQSHFDLTYKEDLSASIKYRWRCKDECAKGNFMGSGLDDYPRVSQKGQISKEHIDLSSWLWFFSDAMENIAKFLQKDKAALFYNRWKHQLREKIIDGCIDESDMLFKDLAVKGEKLFLDQKVTKLGYINLFPFFVGLLQTYDNDSPERVQRIHQVLNKTIQIMMDEKILMSAGGIRSLSLNDSDYASQENYWRGASWMPINYMILRACKLYYWDIESSGSREEVRRLYNQLRSRLIETVKGNYLKTGYLFENYIEGKGNRGYPFYGWTSLIANIMTEEY